jgi:ParB-like chromosome segregation protein Spo0J
MDPVVASEIEQRPVNTLDSICKNARTHSPAQVAQIVPSVSEFGGTTPILIDSGGLSTPATGVMAAKEMGLATVPCIVLGHLTPALLG